jgi:C4-dicarboxylate transporter, DcuC family
MELWQSILPWIGGLIVIGTIYAIIKRWENRMVLFAAGFAMALLAFKPMQTFDAFQKSMTNPGLVSSILTVMGFAYVMKITKCDQHLIEMVAGGLTKVRFALIPGATLATFAINIALTSAAGVAAAVGAILIPVMMAAGIHPAVAAAAVLAGTFGSVLSPANTHVNIVAKMANASPVDVASVVTMPTIVAGVIGAICLAAYAYFRKEDRGHDSAVEVRAEKLQVNYLKAFVPFIPLVLLVLGNQAAFKSWNMTVPAAMLIGTMLAMIVARTSPTEITKTFFDGMGKAYGDIMGIIIAAGVFTAGLTSVGLIGKLLTTMKEVDGAVGLAGTLGPMLIAVLSGSGDAATIAFNEAVTPHAATFGLTMEHLGNLASLAGALGRSMSPVAGACIVVAGIAKASPVEVAKRNMPGMIVATIVVFLMMGL